MEMPSFWQSIKPLKSLPKGQTDSVILNAIVICSGRRHVRGGAKVVPEALRK